MKKFMVGIISFVLAVSFASCDNKDNDGGQKLKKKSGAEDVSITNSDVRTSDDDPWYISSDEMNEVISSYSYNLQIKTANSNAKKAYNAVAEYCGDMETQGYSFDESLAGTVGEFDCWSDESIDEGRRAIYKCLQDNGENTGIVYVDKANINGYDSFFVQWKESEDSEFFGQYPDPIYQDTYSNGDVYWGVYCEP